MLDVISHVITCHHHRRTENIRTKKCYWHV